MIVVIADDLSGAAELAGAALNRGLTAEVQTVFTPATKADVICIDTDSRSLTSAEAALVVGEIARAVAAIRPARIYKKCDSVLRGNVLAEVRAIMAAADLPRAVLISANPARGRVIRDGDYFVEGVPLHATDFARDPSHPRRTARVVELLGGDLRNVATPDAASTTDLFHHANSLEADTLPAGGVEFFDAILAARGTRAKVAIASLETPAEIDSASTLLVCGSAASWPKRFAICRDAGIAAHPLPHDYAAIVAELNATGRAAMGIGEGPATLGRSSVELVLQLAVSVKNVLGATSAGRLLLEGGATAAAVVREMGWTRLTANRRAVQGVGVLASIGKPDMELCIKPGSYEWPAGFWPPG